VKQESCQENKAPSESPTWQKTVVLGVTGLAVFGIAVMPNETWSPEWGNFFGATFVAVGGLLASLHAYEVAQNETGPASWAFIVVGGFAIAGASLQMALAS
jgi:hypothetical protein